MIDKELRRSRVQRFKVAFSPLDWIWDAYLREKRQPRQGESKTWSQIAIIWENEHF
jgi:hypothetical protein